MNCISVIALSALFLALTVADSIDTKNVNMCAKELNLSEDEIARIYPDAWRNPTGNLKCFGKCFVEKKGTLRDGVIQPMWFTQINDGYDNDTARAFVNKCSSIKDEDSCEMARKFMICNDDTMAELRKQRQQI